MKSDTRPVRGPRRKLVVLATFAAGAALLLAGFQGQATRAAPPTPPVTAGLQLWYEADTTAYADGEAVTSWADNSGFGRDLTSLTTGDAPIMRRNAVNGRAAIEFDGKSSLLKTYDSSFTLDQPDTFFIVYRSLDADTSARAFVFDSRDPNDRQVFGRAAASDARLYANNELAVSGIAYPFPGFQIWSGTVDGAASGLFRDGVQIGSGNAGKSGLTGFTVGALNASGQYGYDYSHVLVAEILYYDAALSPAERSSVTDWLDEKYNVIPPPSAPGNTSLPVVTGTARYGSIVTATTGGWTGTQPLVYAYQWQRCDPAGASCSDIAGATSPSYTLTAADAGSTMTAIVTASNGFGFASAVALPTAVVASPLPVNTSAPTLSGTPQEGAALTVTSGKWSGTPPLTFAYQWQRCDAEGLNCVPTPGATAQSYVLEGSDVGFTIRGVAIASDPGGSVAAASAQTPAILPAPAAAPASIEPPVTDGLQLWFEADTEQYADGQAVTTWTDKSGFGRDLTAFAPSQAPVFHRSAVNGRAAIEFDGVTSLMKTYKSTFTLPQPTTFFIVYRSLDKDTATRAFVFDSRSSSSRQIIGREGASEVRLYADLGLSASGVTYPFPDFQLWSGTFNGAASSLYRNGIVAATGDPGPASQAGFTLGGLSTSAEYGYDLSHAQVAEILYYSGSLSAAERRAVTSWLDEKYGVIKAAVATANVWIDQDGGSCVRRATAGAYDDALACGTFQKALDQARPGDTVLVRCHDTATSCTYPPELLSGDPGAGRVTIAPAPGTSASFEEDTGSAQEVFFDDLHHVTFQDIGFGNNNSADWAPNLRIDCSRDLTLINSSGRRFNMFEGNANVTFLGGDWGNYGGADEEDSTMGTTGKDGPLETCPGESAPSPQTNILFDGVTWHDVFYTASLDGCTGGPGSCAEWGASHPDCFEINGYVDGVTIQNSTFYHCGNTMLSLFTDQGDINNVIARNNVFRDMAPTSYYGIQWVDTAAHTCNNVEFLDNTYVPNAPKAWKANTPPRFECVTTSGANATLVAGNTFQEGPPPSDCATDTVPPYSTVWRNNVFVSGKSC